MTSKKQSLYDIDAQISEALDALERDSDAETIALLERATLARSEKMDAIAAAIKSYEAHAAIIADEAKRLAARKKSAERKADMLRTYMASSMLVNAETRIDTTRFTILCSARGPALDVNEDTLDLAAIAAMFPDAVRIKTELARTEVRRLLEAGREVPGVTLVDGGYSVVLR